MTTEQTAIITELERASKGLRFQSESDSPFETFLWEESTPFTPEELLALKRHPPDTPVKKVSLERFFQQATKDESWHNAEERATTKRFQELTQILKETLSSIAVYKVGKVEADVYIVGKTKTGDLAGLSTKVIET